MGSSKQKPARLLLLTRGGAVNGCQHQMRYLVESLDRRRYEPRVVAPCAEGELAELARLGVETRVMPMRNWRRFPEALLRPLDERRLRQWATESNVALVHGADVWKGRYAIRLGQALGIPSVVHVRGPFQRRDVIKHRLREASALVPIAQRFADDLVKWGVPAAKVTLIDDGVDTSRYRPREPDETDVLARDYPNTQGVRLGLVGRIEPFKRQVDFIEAVAPIIQAMPHAATFFIIGAVGSEQYHRQMMQAITRHGLDDQVVLTGRREDMATVMRSLDVLVTLSGGGVMFEAMASGKAVISVREDSRHSVHVRDGETGLCVTDRDPAAATAAMRRLIEDSLLRTRLGTTARQWAETVLSSQVMAKKTTELYDRLLGAATPAATRRGGPEAPGD